MNEAIEKELKQIDEVLNYFRTPFEQGGLTLDNLIKYFDNKKNFGHPLIAILEKLERDKLIFKVDNGSYHITLEGKIFEGYVQQKIDIITAKESKEKYDARMKSNSILLTRGTWVLAAFTLFLVLVELFKHDSVYNIFRCCCH